jgi:uncharacterized protein (DUF58 family)
MAGQGAAPGVYASLDDLVRLQYRARRASFKPRQPVQSVLAGRHASRLRGRGLDFEEIRAYLSGDDVRSIDWRVTARTGSAHVRVYTEERERTALVLVDQRQAMFFGTRLNLKSVAAAEAAALCAWRVCLSGDRVGAVVFDDADLVALRPQRSQAQVLRILEAIVAKNRGLKADGDVKNAPGMLNQALERAQSLAGHDCLIVVASDFDGADEKTHRLVTGLSQHNDVVAVLVHDPSAKDLPERGRLVVAGGELQVQVDVGPGSQREALLAFSSERMKPVLEWPRTLGVPVLPLSTAEDVATQMGRLLGTAAARPGA